MVPFGQQKGEISFWVSCEWTSQCSANPLSQPIMNAPVRWTRRACLTVHGETRSQAATIMAIARMKSENPAQQASSTPPNKWLAFCRSPVTNTKMRASG